MNPKYQAMTIAGGDSVTIYIRIMTEIKERIEAINEIRLSKDLHRRFRVESGFLQLRYICELVALGCLVAHGDIVGKEKKSLLKEYSADTIMKQLSDLHDAFFPVAISYSPAGEVAYATEIQPPPITWSWLQNVYADCGTMLHKGKLKKFLKNEDPVVDFGHVSARAQLLVNHLGCHLIEMKETGITYYCFVYNSTDGEVHMMVGKPCDQKEVEALIASHPPGSKS